VLEDVTVPDEEPRAIELHLHASAVPAAGFSVTRSIHSFDTPDPSGASVPSSAAVGPNGSD